MCNCGIAKTESRSSHPTLDMRHAALREGRRLYNRAPAKRKKYILEWLDSLPEETFINLMHLEFREFGDLHDMEIDWSNKGVGDEPFWPSTPSVYQRDMKDALKRHGRQEITNILVSEIYIKY